ncbi:hypothetical protein [Desertivibrio insolitus]|uniref:hypothetical protein n=1 Tax=Herbiconiux sp. SYSU D00978 TaxID=2812562 RepID=UPI001A95FF77|nr:hypothetical protein [Herbiconiux sp. SYSU D00978]
MQFLADLPLRLNGGRWPTSHVQGVAVDLDRGHVYYSFTTLLVKTALDGTLLGTVGGLSGHLGDITFDPVARRLYGSLEYKAAAAFYVAIFDVDAIDREGLLAVDASVVRTVHLAEVVADYTWSSAVAAQPSLASGSADSRRSSSAEGAYRGLSTLADTSPLRHRYGCSGIDGIAFGPRFGSTDGPLLLTVAYGVFSDLARDDNDHQVLLQYATDDWWEHLARPLNELDPHRSGPSHPDGKYFVRTGNTRFGVQNLEFDAHAERWFLGVYAGEKPDFPNFTLFAVDAAALPTLGPLAGLGGELGLTLALADDGLWDENTGVRGWYQHADVGIAAVGEGLFYLSESSVREGLQTSDVTLHRWSGDARMPFAPVVATKSAPLTTA